MHEWALAESIVKSVLRYAEDAEFDRVRRVRVEIGEMQQITIETLSRLVNEVLAESAPILHGATFDFEIVPAAMRCRACGAEWPLADALDRLEEEEREAIHFVPELARSYLRCPACGSPDFETIAGRGVVIGSIKGEKTP